MKRKLVSIISLCLYSLVLFTACKKSDEKLEAANNQEITSQVDDESQVSNEMDAIALDASTAIEYDPAFSGNNSVLDQIICDATVVYSTSTDPMTITINYNGSNCGGGRVRTGSIVLSMAQGTEWKNPGASFTITFNDLKITKAGTDKSITITGTHTYTNVSGGLVAHLALDGPVTHTVTSENMKVSFDNGTARSWNVAKQRVYTYENGIVLAVNGMHMEGDEMYIAEWGTNRAGASFTTSTVTPVVLKQSCNFRVTGGMVRHNTSAFSVVATFGLNASGEPVGCPGSASFYYKLVWTGNGGNSLTVVLPYQ